MRPIITHFTDDDLYKFTMCCAVVDNFPRAEVRYTFTDRNDMIYPAGFAKALREQIDALADVVMTQEEARFMKRACPYIPHWLYDYLRGFRYNPRQVSIAQDATGHLQVGFEGPWCQTILLEVKTLAIISELYYRMAGLEPLVDLGKVRLKACEKGRRLLEGGCVFSEFGTRRRASLIVQDTVVEAFTDVSHSTEEWAGRFAGTSNIYLAMKYNLTPIGTMAHELICAIAGMYGPVMANKLAMKSWARTYQGALGTFLYDTYGWRIFSLNFTEDYANLFRGLRIDSGDNREQLDKIIAKYRSLGIDPRYKQVVFSNALSTDSALAMQRYAEGRCLPSYGIGTHFTNDIEGLKPLNIVIKLTSVKPEASWPFWCDTCKLSSDPGKHSGAPDVVARFEEALHIR
ncbi:MAG: nicotinate phosphoribosyltransferase [Muribaculaceae bacterium]|nr:nicotinate phosphoribosyltransferase [Muribaculaceae bacterium]